MFAAEQTERVDGTSLDLVFGRLVFGPSRPKYWLDPQYRGVSVPAIVGWGANRRRGRVIFVLRDVPRLAHKGKSFSGPTKKSGDAATLRGSWW